ncbi:MAG: hypothetical protein ACO1NU_08730 [Arcticibacter sp.]
MIIEKTGWSLHYLYWKVSWINVRMMISDAPSFGKKKDEPKKKKMSGKEAVARHKAKRQNG